MPFGEQWLLAAREIVGEHLLAAPEDLQAYAHDEYATAEFNRLPAALVRPGSTAEVARIVRRCAREGVPLTARGGGTGLAAACVPCEGGVVLSLERLARVVEADPANRTITAQAGLTLGRLYEEVEALGLYFPPHPGDEGATRVWVAPAGGSRARVTWVMTASVPSEPSISSNRP